LFTCLSSSSSLSLSKKKKKKKKKKKIALKTLPHLLFCDAFPYAALLPFRLFFNIALDTWKTKGEHLHLDTIVGFYMDWY